MGNFLIVIPSVQNCDHSKQVFNSGIRLAALLKSQTPNRVLETEFASIASFPRLNGSGTPVTTDSQTGNWLATIGTWFHEEGFGSGNENRLLERLGVVGMDRLAEELEGFFVIAFGSAAIREVAVITDIVGTMHCYSRSLPGALVISGSSLLLAGLAEYTLNSVACQEFIATGAMYEDRTFYTEVRKLGPGTCFRYKGGALKSQHRYWHASGLQPNSLDGADAVAAIRDSVIGVARKISSVFPLPVCDLTGGYDSRTAVASFLASNFKICTTVAGPPSDPDVVISKELAQLVGLPHRYLNPEPAGSLEQLQRALELTDGEFDLLEYSRIYKIQAELSKTYDISINSYSGEIGRGYGWEVLRPNTGECRALDATKVAKRRFAKTQFDDSIVPPHMRINLAEHFQSVIERTNEGLTHLPNTVQYDYCMTMLRAQRWYGRIATSTNQIWPCLSFFLMRSVVKPMLETTTKSRKRSLLIRKLLLEIEPTLAKYPLDLGYPPMPVSWTTLHRFWPILPLYGGKIIKKLQGYLAPGGPSSPDSQSAPRLRIWKDPELQDLMLGRSMLCTEVFDGKQLEKFNERSKNKDFSFSDQWTRLLSLELTLYRLKSVNGQQLKM